MDKKVLSFDIFKKMLDEEKVKKIRQNAVYNCYWNEANQMSDKDLSRLGRADIDKEMEQFELTNMTEADYDAEGFIPEYLQYLGRAGRQNNMTVCLRWVIDEELDELEELEPGESLRELGSYWTKNSMSNFSYSEKQKYLHFFLNYRDRATILHSIDEEDTPKASLCVYLIDSDLVEDSSGEGNYKDEDDDAYWENLAELAIKSKDLTKDNFIQSFDIKQTRCENYDQIKHTDNIRKEFLPDEYLYNGDDYEQDNFMN